MGGALFGARAEKFRVRFPRGGPVQHILLDIDDDDEDDEHEEIKRMMGTMRMMKMRMMMNLRMIKDEER